MYGIKSKLIITFSYSKMRSLLIIAVFCLAGLRLSFAREDQTAEMRDELSLLVRRVNNLEEAQQEKDNEIMS